MAPGSLLGTLGGGEPTAVNCENRARKPAKMNFNHSYANSTTEDDEELGNTLVWKSVFGASASALYLLVLAVNAGIVHYEREAPNPQYRTLADRLAAASSAYNVLAASGAMPQAALLETVYSGAEGGLGAAACRVSQFMILSGFLQIIMVYNEAAALRYLYVYYLGTTGWLNEELAFRFLITLNALFGLLAPVWTVFARDTPHVAVLYCMGKNAEDGSETITGVAVLMAVALTLANHAALKFKIFLKWRRRRKFKLQHRRAVGMRWSKGNSSNDNRVFSVSASVSGSNDLPAAPSPPSSLQDGGQVTAILSALVLFPVLLGAVAALHSSPLGLDVRTFLRAAAMIATVLVMPATVYVRKPHLRRFLRRELRSCLCRG